MNDALDPNIKITKSTYDVRDPVIRTSLLELQRRLAKTSRSVIIILAGVEGAGKGDVVNQLNKWFDVRGTNTHAFWDKSDEEAERPRFWRFWRRLPRRSSIGIMLGSWYTEPVANRVHKVTTKTEFAAELAEIERFEQLLTDDGAIIVKFWFRISRRGQRKRLLADQQSGRATDELLEFNENYARYMKVWDLAHDGTHTETAPWHVIESKYRRNRSLNVAEIVIKMLQNVLNVDEIAETKAAISEPLQTSKNIDGHITGLATRYPMLASDDYEIRLKEAQKRLKRLGWHAYERGISTVCVFEGWDAAGKGGAIRRLTAALDARLYRVISIAAPSEEEHARPYLWRFWQQLPRAGHATIYDRSWYGRVLVERVEKFCTQPEWQRAFEEINDFESQLTARGIVLQKFWLDITPDVQLERFKERQQTPWKQHKITAEDWRNRERWPDYENAVRDMLERTNNIDAPWAVIGANDKRHARISVLESMCARLQNALENYPG